VTRSVPSALQATLSTPAFKLADLIKITRTDGIRICMTTWDFPITVDLGDGDGLMEFSPRNISGVTAFAASVNASIDDSELSTLVDSTIIADDVRRGFFQNAVIAVGYVDPDDPANPWLHRTYEVGECKIEGVTAKFELLGPEKRLERPWQVPLTLNCRHSFGDVDCGININVPVWQANHVYNEGDEVAPSDPTSKKWFYVLSAGTGGIGTSGPTEPDWSLITSGTGIDNEITWQSFDARKVLGVVTAVTDARNFGADGIDIGNDYFAEGYIEWLYGRNKGERQRVRFDNGLGSIIQHRPCLDVPQIGDTFFAIVGCRKRLAEDCVRKHDNQHRSSSRTLRFGGFPFLAPVSSSFSADKGGSND
jgi:hypothetical protein